MFLSIRLLSLCLLSSILSVSFVSAADYKFAGTAQRRHEHLTSHFSSGETKPLSWWERGYMTGDWWGIRTKLAKDGVTIGATYVTDILGNPVGGNAHGFAFAGSLGVDMNIRFGAFSNLDWLSFYSSVVARTGTNLSADKILNQFTVAQVYGGQNVRANENYFKIASPNGLFVLKAGRIDGGNDFLQSDLYYEFVNNGIDGNPVSIFVNSPAFSAYPNATWGASLRCVPRDRVVAKFGVYTAEPRVRRNRYHGFKWDFDGSDGVLLITEWGYEVNRRKTDKGCPGNYRAGVYYVTEQSGRKFSGESYESDWGYYFLLDQMIYRKPGSETGGLTPFVTLLFAPEDRNPLPFFLTAGLVYKGLFSRRPDDYTNLGCVYGRYSSRLREAQRLMQTDRLSGSFESDPQYFESVIECNHRFQMNKWLQVIPDIQYIIRPKGLKNRRNVLVVGVQVGAVF
ncbi:MAG: carbohydrate porin [Simkaniaceae bacterium]|nr:carbohydrate porin [Simkaniaceae bacterium]